MGPVSSLPRRLYNSAHLAALAMVEHRVPYRSQERLLRLQSRRLQAIVRHAYESVPYYRRTMDELGLKPGDVRSVADLTKLPLIDGTMVRLNPEQFASTRYDETSRQTLYSGGSSSHVRRAVYWDHGSVLRKLPRDERDRAVLYKLAGRRWGRRQLHIFPPNGTSLAIMPFYDAQAWVSRRIVERHTFSAEEPYDALVAKLNEFRPHIAFSYGSYAEHFVRYLVESGRRVTLPRVWRYGGDMLSPSAKELMEGSFGCLVHSSYIATESGRIGYQCERREGFHLNLDLCALRVVDESGQEVPPGTDGEIVVSNLHNRAMVLLNYRLGDRGALGTEPCTCGRNLPLLERLEGRQSEQIALADGRVLSTLVVDMLFKREINATLKAQVVNPAPGEVTWRIVPLAGSDQEALRRSLLARGTEEFGSDTRVDVEFVADIPPTRAGKFARVVRSTDASPAPGG